MAATVDPFDDRALGFRVAVLERNETHNADKLARVDDVVDEHSRTLAVQQEWNANLTAAVSELKGAVTWTTRTLIGLCVTIAGSAALLHFG